MVNQHALHQRFSCQAGLSYVASPWSVSQPSASLNFSQKCAVREPLVPRTVICFTQARPFGELFEISCFANTTKGCLQTKVIFHVILAAVSNCHLKNCQLLFSKVI